MRNAVFPHYKSVHLTTYVKGEIGLVQNIILEPLKLFHNDEVLSLLFKFALIDLIERNHLNFLNGIMT